MLSWGNINPIDSIYKREYNKIMKSWLVKLLGLESELEKSKKKAIQELKSKIDSLYDVLAHGDEDHKAWLKKAINAHFSGQPKPEYQPSLNEKKIALLEEEILRLKSK